MMITKYLFLIFLLVFSIFGFANQENYSEFRIIDGDTIKKDGVSYRLHGIDAPETKQICNLNDEDWQCGLAATGYLQKLHGDDGFKCEELGRDRYKRVIARCYTFQDDSKEDIGSLMVREGYALAYRRYSKDYIDEEELAKENKRGLWRSKFIKPWEWRRDKSKRK
jgi:endonuclease YncB( thermonuclease family)